MPIDKPLDLARKLAAILMLLSGNRVNALSHMKITRGDMTLTDKEFISCFDDMLKHSRPGFGTDPLTFLAYKHEPLLCPVETIRRYLEWRAPRSNIPYLFITSSKPYRPPKPQTISGWLKTVLG